VHRYEFSGHYECSIDVKHRTTLPKNLRESLGDDFCIGVSMELNCVTLYPGPIWQAIADSMRAIPATNISAYQYAGTFRGFSFIGQNFDAQGRVVLPELLIEYVGLSGPAMYVGNGDRIDIRGRDEVLRISNATRADAPSMLEQVEEISGEAMRIALELADRPPDVNDNQDPDENSGGTID